MKSIARLCLPLAILLCAVPAAAQMYKWVGPDGKVHYSDTPPPKDAAKSVERKTVSGGNPEANLPYELAQVVRNQPVTLYSASDCAPCEAARSQLKQRGVPFVEKTINTAEDQQKFRSIAPTLELPLIMVGRTRLKGFESGQLNESLSAAGYPEKSILPRNYQFRAAEALAPKQAAKETAAASPSPTPTPTPVEVIRAPNDNTPPGFQF
ncbi:glutaredoxin family protein [Massilia sp. W12]|uniref:glutaredoxin family protein n=1 Tax=Massilia sp. W12 TaxID=3126507 RepID=UPI0030CF0CBD